MDTVRKILFFTVGLILTVSFIAIGITMFNKSKTAIDNTNSQYTGMLDKYSNIAYAMYEGGAVASGYEVAKLINELTEEEVTICVKNGACAGDQNAAAGVSYNCKAGKSCGYGNGDTTKITYDEALAYISDKSKRLYYINPTASFSSEVLRDGNGVISGLTFIQK